MCLYLSAKEIYFMIWIILMHIAHFILLWNDKFSFEQVKIVKWNFRVFGYLCWCILHLFLFSFHSRFGFLQFRFYNFCICIPSFSSLHFIANLFILSFLKLFYHKINCWFFIYIFVCLCECFTVFPFIIEFCLVLFCFQKMHIDFCFKFSLLWITVEFLFISFSFSRLKTIGDLLVLIHRFALNFDVLIPVFSYEQRVLCLFLWVLWFTWMCMCVFIDEFIIEWGCI